jgi:LPPG:FO 2-phospho-L-lactate transferase
VERGGAGHSTRSVPRPSLAKGVSGRLVKLAVLAGGTGAAKLLRGLAPLVDPSDLTIIGNVGDDAEIWGLHVSPDLDTLCYTLAGLLDEAKGWGLRDESFHALDHMVRFGEPGWFKLGDRDLATHLHRTRLLKNGRTLSEVTASIASSFGVAATLLPMSNQAVRTRLLGPEGWLEFQEYFVRDRAQVEISEVEYAGAATAMPAPGVLEAIRAARAVIVCPSNPITSVGPILAVPGIIDALAETAASTVAISPIVGHQAVSGPAGQLMEASGFPVSAAGIARLYARWLDILVFDEQDRQRLPEILELGVSPVTAQTIMANRKDEAALARRVLELLG